MGKIIIQRVDAAGVSTTETFDVAGFDYIVTQIIHVDAAPPPAPPPAGIKLRVAVQKLKVRHAPWGLPFTTDLGVFYLPNDAVIVADAVQNANGNSIWARLQPLPDWPTNVEYWACIRQDAIVYMEGITP